MTVTIRHGDCREILRTMPDQSVHCCVTSPPYFGLRDYGHVGQIGIELTPDLFVEQMVDVFREVRRVLRDDGTLWLNLGDTYMPVNYGPNAKRRQDSPGSDQTMQGKASHWAADIGGERSHSLHKGCKSVGLKDKDLIGIPWRVAFALQADGWYLRQDIIWAKPNPMPESVTDRCTKSHEYIFLMSKSRRYHYDADAIAEGLAPASIDRLSQPNLASQAGSDRVPGKTNGAMKAVGRVRGVPPRHAAYSSSDQAGLDSVGRGGTRNKRSVWNVATQPFSQAHFATFPPELIEPCIKAGCPAGGAVLDPFGGAGTTGMVADRLGRDAILIELNPEYALMAQRRIEGDAGMFGDVLGVVGAQQPRGADVDK